MSNMLALLGSMLIVSLYIYKSSYTDDITDVREVIYSDVNLWEFIYLNMHLKTPVFSSIRL